MLDLSHSRLTSLFGLKDAVRCGGGVQQQADGALTEMDLSGNALESFEHFGTHPELRVLKVEDNRISSFLGMTKQRSLEDLHVTGNPVALHRHYRIMALLTVGFSLRRIDGKAVESTERDMARKLGPSAALAVSYGWLLDPVPRSTTEYDAIIAELRQIRKLRQESSAPAVQVRTVPMVMAEKQAMLSTAPQPSSATCSQQPLHTSTTVTAETVELQNKALLHFSKRVVQLERYVTELQQALRRASEVSMAAAESTSTGASSGAPLSQSQSRGCGAAACVGLHVDELNASCSVQFDRGITVFGPSASTGVPITITFHREGFLLHRFFNRVCLADMLYRDVVASEVDVEAQRFVLSTRQGTTVDLCFEQDKEGHKPLTFVGVWKLLHFRCPPGSVVAPWAALAQSNAPGPAAIDQGSDADKRESVPQTVGNSQPSPSLTQGKPAESSATAAVEPPKQPVKIEPSAATDLEPRTAAPTESSSRSEQPLTSQLLPTRTDTVTPHPAATASFTPPAATSDVVLQRHQPIQLVDSDSLTVGSVAASSTAAPSKVRHRAARSSSDSSDSDSSSIDVPISRSSQAPKRHPPAAVAPSPTDVVVNTSDHDVAAPRESVATVKRPPPPTAPVRREKTPTRTGPTATATMSSSTSSWDPVSNGTNRAPPVVPARAKINPVLDDSPSPVRVPPPKRTGWRGKAIEELAIESSDSD